MTRRRLITWASVATALAALGWWHHWPTLRLDDETPEIWGEKWQR